MSRVVLEDSLSDGIFFFFFRNPEFAYLNSIRWGRANGLYYLLWEAQRDRNGKFSLVDPDYENFVLHYTPLMIEVQLTRPLFDLLLRWRSEMVAANERFQTSTTVRHTMDANWTKSAQNRFFKCGNGLDRTTPPVLRVFRCRCCQMRIARCPSPS